MRLFVAVEIDPVVARHLAEFSDEVRSRIRARAPRARMTWVPVERLHLTVRFIGEVGEGQAAAIAAELEPPLTASPFEVTVEGAGAFPAAGAPRVIWAGVAGGLEALAALEHEVSGRLAACGVPRADRTYHPHLTLARVRESAGLRAGALLDRLAARRFGATWVDAITLFQSRLSPKGPTYVALQRTPLHRRT